MLLISETASVQKPVLCYAAALCAVQSPAVSAVDQEEPVLDAAVKPEFSSTSAEREMDVSICHEPGNSSEMPGDLTRVPVENAKDMHMHVKRTSFVGSKPYNSSADNSASHNLVSPSRHVSANPSDEAVDLTSSVRTSPATKRKRRVSNSARSSKEDGLNELGDAVSVNDVDNCSESSSIVCIKDEVPSAADINTDWLSSVRASVTPEGKSLSKQSSRKASSSLDNINHSSSVTEDLSNTTSDQVVCALIVLSPPSERSEWWRYCFCSMSVCVCVCLSAADWSIRPV